MLHHANVDRLWAYWQAMKPKDATFQVPYQGGSRYSTPGGTTIGPNSALQPFLKAGGGFHTAQTVNSIRGFGYSYQGLEYWAKSPDQMRQDATQIINRLYSPKYSHGQAKVLLEPSAPRKRYFARVSVDVTQLDRPCEVNVIVGGTRAGSMAVMNQPSTGIMHGAFSVDDAVMTSGSPSLSVDSAVDSIRSRMRIEIIKVSHTGCHSKYVEEAGKLTVVLAEWYSNSYFRYTKLARGY